MKPTLVCRLKKSLYGLKQAPRVWNKTIDDYLTRNGFTTVPSDPCIYIGTQERVIIFLYVDDLLIAATLSLLKNTKALLTKRFKMKDLGEATSLLGMEIIRDRSKKTLDLRQSLEWIHKRYISLL